MKKLWINHLIMVLMFFISNTVSAQTSINIELQPVWGPVGYDYVEYYYFPEYEMYYYVPQRQYVYLDGGNWVFVNTLPPRIRTVNLYSTYKVVVNEPKAYLHFNEHRVQYVKYKNERSQQVVIRDSKDPRYYVIKDHPMHGKEKGGNEHNQGRPEQHNMGNKQEQQDKRKDNQPHEIRKPNEAGIGRAHETNMEKHKENHLAPHEQHKGNGGNMHGGNDGEHAHGQDRK